MNANDLNTLAAEHNLSTARKDGEVLITGCGLDGWARSPRSGWPMRQGDLAVRCPTPCT